MDITMKLNRSILFCNACSNDPHFSVNKSMIIITMRGLVLHFKPLLSYRILLQWINQLRPLLNLLWGLNMDSVGYSFLLFVDHVFSILCLMSHGLPFLSFCLNLSRYALVFTLMASWVLFIIEVRVSFVISMRSTALLCNCVVMEPTRMRQPFFSLEN